MDNNSSPPQFAVVFTYSPDGDTAVYLFPDEDTAKEFLRDNYKECLRSAKEECGTLVLGQISEDGWYAKVSALSQDAGEISEMRIGKVYS